MTLAKRLLLGSAAAFVATSGAQAADLGLPVAPAVDYVQICSMPSGGSGFILPGSDVCFQISGFARYQVTMNGEDHGAAGNWLGGTAAAPTYLQMLRNTGNDVAHGGFFELAFDAQTMTEYGLLRGFILLEGSGGGNVSAGDVYIQFGGLTAGHTSSFFNPEFDGTALGPNGGLAGDTDTGLIGYTASFGNGVTAGISIETQRQLSAVPAVGLGYDESQTMPDIVANIRVGQAWGSAKLAAAVHEIDPAAAVIGTPFDSEYGYAVSASANINLPFGFNSNFGVVGTYTNGALGYIGFDPIIGGVNLPHTDYVINTAGTGIDLTTGWMVGAGFEFGVTPDLDIEIDGFYASIDHGGAAGTVAAPGTDTLDGNQWSVRGSVAWRPVNGLEIRGGVSYQQYDYDSLLTGAGVVVPLATAAAGALDLPDDELAARLRITRSF
ncbi:MAG: porin [Devosiaceae bacterium]|nr:porin [Devosiaceae bacterium MH13]